MVRLFSVFLTGWSLISPVIENDRKSLQFLKRKAERHFPTSSQACSRVTRALSVEAYRLFFFFSISYIIC